MKPWFTAQAAAGDPTRAEVWILDQIGETWWGEGTSAKGFIEAVQALGELQHLDLYVNSPGGNVADGLAIRNYLARHPATVTATVMGQAASIASVILTAANTVIMPSNTTQMVHLPWSGCVGNAEDMRWMAGALDKIGDGLVAAYVEKTGLDAETVLEHLRAETYLTAEDAVGLGYADLIAEPVKIAASHDTAAALAACRAEAQARVEEQRAAPPPDAPAVLALEPEQLAALAAGVQQLLEAAQIDALNARTALIQQGGGLIQIDGTGLAPELQRVMQELIADIQARVLPPPPAAPPPQEVVATCRAAGHEWLALAAIEGGESLARVEQRLAQLSAAADVAAAARLSPSPALLAACAAGNAADIIRHVIDCSRPAHDDIRNHHQPGTDAAGAVPNVIDIYQRRKNKRR